MGAFEGRGRHRFGHLLLEAFGECTDQQLVDDEAT